MKILPILNNINFSKNIISNTKVRTTEGENARVTFVEYDPYDQKDRAQIRRTNMLWQPEAIYMKAIANFFNEAGSEENRKYKSIHDSWHFYGLEDKEGETLAIAFTKERTSCPNYKIGDEETLKIDFIQTHPDEIFSSKIKQYKGLGETLVSKIVGEADKKKKDSVILDSDNEYFWTAGGYFEQCGIKGGMPLRRLSKENFSGYIKYVESKKTKKAV